MCSASTTSRCAAASVYATVLIDAETAGASTSCPTATPTSLRTWLREHPGVEVVCRDGSGAYGEAVRSRAARSGAGRRPVAPVAQPGRGRPQRGRRAQHLLGRRAAAPGRQAGRDHPASAGSRSTTCASKGVGLLDCARRLGLSLNTVKRYARASEPERLQRVPKYRPTLVDPYRDHLRKRRAEEPGRPGPAAPARDPGARLPGQPQPARPLHQPGPSEADRPHLSPRRPPAPAHQAGQPHRRPAETLARLTAACPEMTALASLIRSFAALLTPDPGNDGRLQAVDRRRPGRDLPHLHSFTRGLDLDIKAATAALTLPVPQRPHRRRQHQDENDQATNVRPRWVRPPPPPHPARLRHAPSPPKVRQSPFFDVLFCLNHQGVTKARTAAETLVRI